MNGSAFRARRGFTLVELLVVIAIIGVLMALLLPALSSARTAANASGSASNLSGFGRGFELYKNANNGSFCSGAFTHTFDGDMRQYGWVADLLALKVSQPGKALDQGSRNKVNLATADYMGAHDCWTEIQTGTADGRWSGSFSGYADVTGTSLGGSATDALALKEVWDAGHNSNYVTTWQLVRGDPSASDAYGAGNKGVNAGDGPLTDNHLNQGNTTAARVALMGPGRGSSVAVSAAMATTMQRFAGSPIVKANDVLVDRFTGGMTVTGSSADSTLAGAFIHEFTQIEPLHQPKTAQGTGGHAPILFADGHVEKVQDSVTTGATENSTKGDGYLGNNASRAIGPLGYQEVADQMWARRLRTSQPAATTGGVGLQ
jgi:prepilin-type N-terminal cleavage/methylation domain-containing protein/prepilin-type processing-associated H-X9-DG protein